MAKFPRTEPEVIALANGLIAGLTANTTVYPSPPLTIEGVRSKPVGRKPPRPNPIVKPYLEKS
ncbi:MAG: hypothetical protein EBE86_016745 [Hormoscilla sp. GUM202]|nr:hypothetical protein [Hormoscilla sp. GUM202]